MDSATAQMFQIMLQHGSYEPADAPRRNPQERGSPLFIEKNFIGVNVKRLVNIGERYRRAHPNGQKMAWIQGFLSRRLG
jgi:hypothetical protein